MFSKAILKAEVAERVALDYRPKKIPTEISKVASQFVQNQNEQPTHFRMNPLIAEQSGVADLERLTIEGEIEQKTLERLKEVQESAYKEAHALGLEQGRAEAFSKYDSEMVNQLQKLGMLIESITELKNELVHSNETHIIKMIYYIASRLAMAEIAQNPEAILPVLQKAMESSQGQEQFVIRLSPEDFQFLNSTMERLQKDYDSLKRAKLVESPDIRSGGCVIETNFGVVDATLEERLQKLMDVLLSSAPKVRDAVAS